MGIPSFAARFISMLAPFTSLVVRILSCSVFRLLKPRLHDATSCQTGVTTGCTTGCIVYTNIQPVVKPV